MEQNQNPQQFNTENQQASPFEQDAQNQNQQAVPFYQEYQQPMYSPVAVKKRVNPAVFIVPIAILAVAAIVVLLIVLLGGKGGYKGAEERFISQMLGGMSSTLSETEKVSSEPQSITVSFEASNSQITDYIGISDITFTAETAVKNEDIFAHMSLAAGDSLFNGKFWFDKDSSSFLMVLPEISSVYLQASVAADVDAQEPQIDPDKAMKVLNDIIAKTAETYFEVVGDTKIVSGQELTLNGTVYKADKVEIKLDKVQIATVSKAFLENLVNNDDAMDILCAYYGKDEEEVLEILEIEDAIDDLEDIIEECDGSEGSFEMTVWMQGGNIIGRDIVIVNSYGDTGELSFYQIPVSEGCITYVEVLPDDFRCLIEDKVNGELHSGTVTVSDGDEEVTAEYKDLAVTDKLFQGEAKVVVTGSEAFEITAELKAEGDTKTVLISVPNVCRVTVTAEPSQLSFEDMPQLSAGEVAVIDGDEDMYEDEAFNQFLNDVMVFMFGADIF